ncbi:MAG: hypothetical protein Q8M15_05610 [Bacteroidota bacterium]|nr:hypothetical protein [Bacteroidota bacterium]
MSTTPKTTKTEQIWTSLFLLIPVLSLTRFSENFTQDSMTNILISGALGLIGGLLGFGCYYFVKPKNITIKILALIILTTLSFTTIFIVSKVKYQTWEICGYIAVDRKSEECNVCGNVTWEKELTYDKETDKHLWLTDEQLFWFAIDSLNQPFDFYEPNAQDNFLKDKSWRPNITEKDLAESYIELTQEK